MLEVTILLSIVNLNVGREVLLIMLIEQIIVSDSSSKYKIEKGLLQLNDESNSFFSIVLDLDLRSSFGK